MSRKQSNKLDELLEEILTDAHGDEEQLWALRQALEDNVKVPCAAMIAGEPVTVTEFDYDGNARRGLTATIRRPDGTKHVVAAADIRLADATGYQFIAAYRRWMGVEPGPEPTRSNTGRTKRTAALSDSIDVVVLSLSAQVASCKILSTGEVVALRAGRRRQVVPGEIATIKPTKYLTYNGNAYLSGSIESTRLDAKAIGLTPLRLQPCDDWDPAEEYWGEPGEPVAAWAKKIIKGGRRLNSRWNR
jgi:hypothetical protein